MTETPLGKSSMRHPQMAPINTAHPSGAPPPAKKTGRLKPADKKKLDEHDERPMEVVDYQKTCVYIKPADQLHLPADVLEEVLPRQLSAINPRLPLSVVRFSYAESGFKPYVEPEHWVSLLAVESHVLHSSSEDARDQLEKQEDKSLRRQKEKAEGVESLMDASLLENTLENKGLNQFRFSERFSQTAKESFRDRGIATEPPPSVQFCSQATPAEIYDAYVQDLERQAQKTSKGEDKAEDTAESRRDAEMKKQQDMQKETALAKTRAIKILERMVNENLYYDIAVDYKFWEDPADVVRGNDGAVLPLWKFAPEAKWRGDVTSISANPNHDDLVAIGYGSYDFMNQTSGMISIYSYKNPSAPEYTFYTDSGVMSLQFHPTHTSLLAVGLYNGVVCVYDVAERGNKPIFSSSARNGKHSDPVWQICWQVVEDLAKSTNFFSVSSDGRVTLWTLSKNELQFMDIMVLHLSKMTKELSPDEETSLLGQEGGTCFDFHKSIEHLFLVGTEDGKIHKCSKAYTSQYLETYEGHFMAVYGVRWNHFHPRIFLSCSADWTVRIWDHNYKQPLMSFDLECEVGDVCWAPYSSTVFAAVTADGKIHVYDLKVDTCHHICAQKIVNKAKPTRITFSNRDPIIYVGDSSGNTTAFKLSPNLRKSFNEHTPPQVEVEAMDKILSQEHVETKLNRTGNSKLEANKEADS